jgi:hypothetical protein
MLEPTLVLTEGVIHRRRRLKEIVFDSRCSRVMGHWHGFGKSPRSLFKPRTHERGGVRMHVAFWSGLSLKSCRETCTG